MRFSDVVGLARENLSRAPLRTSLTAIGVAIGTAAVVTLISVGNGAEAFLVNRAASFGQVTLAVVVPNTPYTRDKGGDFHALTPATVRAMGRIHNVDAVYRWISTPSLRLTVDGHSADVSAVGQTPITTQLGMLTRVVPDETNGVLVPDTVARKLGLAPAALVGRQVTLTAGGDVCCNSGNSIVVLGPARRFAARIVGVYKGSSWAVPMANLKLDRNAIPLLVATPLAADIDGLLRGISGAAYLQRQGYDQVIVHSDDARQTADVAARIRAMNYQVYDRADLLTQVHTVFTVLTFGLGAIGGIALLVAAIGIANTLIMTILERTREIGIMKALGAEPGTVRTMFLVETALIGLVGGVVGLALAAAVGVIGNKVFAIWLKGQGVADNVNAIFSMSVELIVGALALAVVVSLLAGALPSRRAVRLQPLDALRYE